MLDLLLEAGILVNPTDGHGRTAMLDFATGGRVEAVLKLLAVGVDVNQTDEHGATALFRASEKGHLAVVSVFLDAGADVYLQDKSHFSAWSYSNQEIKDFLLHHGVIDLTAYSIRTSMDPTFFDLVQGMKFLAGVCHYLMIHASSRGIVYNTEIFQVIVAKKKEMLTKIAHFHAEVSPKLKGDCVFFRTFPFAQSELPDSLVSACNQC